MLDKEKICMNTPLRGGKVFQINHDSGLEGLECELSIAISNYLDPSQDAWKREEGWMNFMKYLYNQYPQNLDITALYAIASLGQAANAPNHISIEKSTEITNTVRLLLRRAVQSEPGMNHPGILHGLTHAYDSMDPGIAVQGIVYGEQLARLFNYSAHAVHMVSHLYLATSNWSKVGEINEKAYLASQEFCKSKVKGGLSRVKGGLYDVHVGLSDVDVGLSDNVDVGGLSDNVNVWKCDKDDKYHAFEWTHYALLQQEPCTFTNITTINSNSSVLDRKSSWSGILDRKSSWIKVEEMERIWKQDKDNVDYENWLFRMYARQTFKDLECKNQKLLGDSSCFKEYPLEKRIVVGNSWIPQISPLVKDYWILYSSAGALIARFFAELYSKNGYDIAVLEKISKEMQVISVQSINQTFIDKLHSSFSQITLAVISLRKCRINQSGSSNSSTICTQSLYKNWDRILERDMQNKRTDAAPTLPIIPIPSLYILFMEGEGLLSREDRTEKCGWIRKVWGNRYECQDLS